MRWRQAGSPRWLCPVSTVTRQPIPGSRRIPIRPAREDRDCVRGLRSLGDDVIVSDVSSNTVSLLISGGKLVGAFDACIFAPGTLHGALDVDAIRRVDAGKCTANEAFQHAAWTFHFPRASGYGRWRCLPPWNALHCACSTGLRM